MNIFKHCKNLLKNITLARFRIWNFPAYLSVALIVELVRRPSQPGSNPGWDDIFCCKFFTMFRWKMLISINIIKLLVQFLICDITYASLKLCFKTDKSTRGLYKLKIVKIYTILLSTKIHFVWNFDHLIFFINN